MSENIDEAILRLSGRDLSAAARAAIEREQQAQAGRVSVEREVIEEVMTAIVAVRGIIPPKLADRWPRNMERLFDAYRKLEEALRC